MSSKYFILLSFDVEEFDMPMEYYINESIEEQLKAGHDGLIIIKEMLRRKQVNATLFTTGNFAIHYPEIIKELSMTHEIASHTFSHTAFHTKDLRESKDVLERITGKEVTGIRMPRMRKTEMKEIAEAGYRYDSSVNPIWLPGRYNNLNKPRTPFLEDKIVCIPASVSTFLRIPLFWLSFKNLPYSVYLKLVLNAIRKDGHVCLYFHPWEFTDLHKYKLPGYTRKPDGEVLLKRLEKLIGDLADIGQFITMHSFYEKTLLSGRLI